jgi:hypothetical protein
MGGPRGPYKKRQQTDTAVSAPTKDEIAKMIPQDLYDSFGTRYPKNSK